MRPAGARLADHFFKAVSSNAALSTFLAAGARRLGWAPSLPHHCHHKSGGSILRTLSLAGLLLGLASGALAQSASPPPESVTITGQKVPPDRFLRDFIVSYTAPSPASGRVARWHSGICPGVIGLPAAWNDTVDARVRAVAAQAGAPVLAKPCRANIDIV